MDKKCEHLFLSIHLKDISLCKINRRMIVNIINLKLKHI